jgi:hypothetical protein
MTLGDEANGTETRDRKVSVGNVSLMGSFYDGFNGEGGKALFVTGEPTVKVKEILSFLRDDSNKVKKAETF